MKNLRYLAETDRFPQLTRSTQGDGAHSNSMERRSECNKQFLFRCRRNVSNRCIQQDTAPLVTAHHTAGDTSQSTLLKIYPSRARFLHQHYVSCFAQEKHFRSGGHCAKSIRKTITPRKDYQEQEKYLPAGEDPVQSNQRNSGVRKKEEAEKLSS